MTPGELIPAAEQVEHWRAVHAPWSPMGLDLFAWTPPELAHLVTREGGKVGWYGNIPQLDGVSIWTAPSFRPGFVSLRQGGREVLALDLRANLVAAGMAPQPREVPA